MLFNKDKFTFKNFIKRYHGEINTLYISKSYRDTPLDRELYNEWFNETNKVFEDIDIDLQHGQLLDDFPQLKSYLNCTVRTFGLWFKDGKVYCEIDLD